MSQNNKITKALSNLEKLINLAREDAMYAFKHTARASETIRHADEAVFELQNFINTNYQDDASHAQVASLLEELRELRVHHNQKCTCGALM